MSALADRPADPVVGLRAPHESAALHVTGAAMYTDDLAARDHGVLTAWPVQSTNAHARVAVDIAPAYEVPGVVRVLTAADVPGLNDAGIKHDEPLFPSEAMFLGHALVWVLGETQEAASVIVTRARHYAGPYVVAPEAALDEPLLHVCLFERWGWMHALRFGAALLTGALPRTPGYRVLTGRRVRISVTDDAGERRRQPVQIDGDDALILPVSIGLAPRGVRVLRS